ncbi:PWWP domain-containing DNA repair factor 3A-like [Dunckerocampus dactyliophorus]|uniref:PWWP domain-containing DNA repair factor 3A-like n=1 Tax=Dunckerocampus dactyliophorus TaxID=161453 RepID=UPI002405F909|nr:PWWP domain-containing DNA repair factor 3A-like [Dunckerocampus dactyliophorus]XP_054625625.1 PWWP domain-containing DNA repair factor 3A-like [Dunckerocampus dactyliophorus]XP_054625626.1 PWWP domain-containing DNA repair factor 3A-like [Dunckerocampus dactyliophorus]XP_054625627.1 PWWP domain-containing DNA repair factor 3A-like [Dunckerocampus dactyliophorus]XP_054625628.1 PWWP domain-containing DNA repair factor 3A-like [Dunckerocampus dactyliophorus]XP_054625629.1 PWWP domain-containi
MKGKPRQTRKKQPKKTSRQTRNSGTINPSDFHTDDISTVCTLPCTPPRRRGRPRKIQEAFLTATPLHSLSRVQPPNISSEAKDVKGMIPAVGSPCYTLNSHSRKTIAEADQPRQLQKRLITNTQTTCPATKRRCYRKQKKDTMNLQMDDTATQLPEPSSPRFELKQDKSLLSSDLSIELSDHKEQLPQLSFQEETGDEEELPSFLMQTQKKPPSIKEGAFVWCKYRHFPTWPALVKRVNHKTKKATILYVDELSIKKKKGFTVSLKSLKPFDCEGANENVTKYQEKNVAALEWSLELITDYIIRIACGSFSGSFLEYCAHDMSYPVRRKYPQTTSISSDPMTNGLWGDQREDDVNGVSIQEEEEASKCAKRLLPDRTHAAHNRANEKLVHFIVKQRMVEDRLLAVIRGQAQSRWLRHFQTSDRRRVGNIYLEDEQQLDQVYSYLNELYGTAVATVPYQDEVEFMERVPFVLDVLLPEAITYAIAGVDNVSIEKAEEKYLKGRCISNRETQEFDLMIERLISLKSHSTFSISADA